MAGLAVRDGDRVRRPRRRCGSTSCGRCGHDRPRGSAAHRPAQHGRAGHPRHPARGSSGPAVDRGGGQRDDRPPRRVLRPRHDQQRASATSSARGSCTATARSCSLRTPRSASTSCGSDRGRPRRGPRASRLGAGARAESRCRAYAAMRTVQALERLAFSPLSAPELATALEIHPRTARRLLQRLEPRTTSARRPGRGAATTSHAAWPRSAARPSPTTSSQASRRPGSRRWPAEPATSPRCGSPPTPTSSASCAPTRRPVPDAMLGDLNPRTPPPPARPCSPTATPGATASSPNPYSDIRRARSPTPATGRRAHPHPNAATPPTTANTTKPSAPWPRRSSKATKLSPRSPYRSQRRNPRRQTSACSLPASSTTRPAPTPDQHRISWTRTPSAPLKVAADGCDCSVSYLALASGSAHPPAPRIKWDARSDDLACAHAANPVSAPRCLEGPLYGGLHRAPGGVHRREAHRNAQAVTSA